MQTRRFKRFYLILKIDISDVRVKFTEEKMRRLKNRNLYAIVIILIVSALSNLGIGINEDTHKIL